jgi:hypothetical protein
MDSRIEDFLRVLCQGAFIFACSAQVKFSNAFIAENQTSLLQSNEKACLAQTGDE